MARADFPCVGLSPELSAGAMSTPRRHAQSREQTCPRGVSMAPSYCRSYSSKLIRALAMDPPSGQLALFFRTLPGGRFFLTCFLTNVYHSRRPRANWLCLYRMSRAPADGPCQFGAHPVLAYLGGSAPIGMEERRSRRSQRRGGSGAWTLPRARHRSSIPTTSHPPATFSGGGSGAEPLSRRPLGGFLRNQSD